MRHLFIHAIDHDAIDNIQRIFGHIIHPALRSLSTKQALRGYQTGCSLGEVARELGVTLERIHQIEALALK